MSGARDALLVEIGSEELPPRELQSLARAFAAELARGLAEAGVLDAPDAPGAHRWFATPRRLAVLIAGVAAAQPRRM
ncbi:MAG: glycine--tRNA ligase subunit beta, partial [Gammaproteobacteria bacterium]